MLLLLVGRSNTYVTLSSDSIDKLCDTAIEDGNVLVSFYVQSLLTSILMDLSVDACVSELETDPTLPERTPIDALDWQRLLTFFLENTYFAFDGYFYEQDFATLEELHTTLLKQCKTLHRIDQLD
ncbi:hypothetical protein MTO96_051002 [Rhipicephalus appendiculatus]